MKKENFIQLFFTVAACSWMPHWACHYYRLETESTFVVGNWNYTTADSIIAMFIYTVLISLNIVSVVYGATRFISALLSGIFHLSLAVVHLVRLIEPFTFKVFGYEWSRGASIREIGIVLPFSIICLVIAVMIKAKIKKADHF